MHWIERDGQQLPRRLAGHPALDFCNTLAGWNSAPQPRGEWLRDYDTFIGWTAYAGLLDPEEEAALRGRSGARAVAVLDEARSFRERLHTAVLEPTDTRAVSNVGALVRRAAAGLRLEPGADPAWRVEATRRLELPLLRVAWAAGQLLTSGELDRVKACPGDECGWLFLDRSGRRRWCSMESCGNRAKVRAHAARHR
jgi:predicted RNA-binding Zn ribbon-like protein